MKSISKLGIAFLVLCGLVAGASAAPKAPTCPVCKMTLTPKKTKDNTVAVKIKGKTFYCCSHCKMPGHAGKKA